MGEVLAERKERVNVETVNIAVVAGLILAFSFIIPLATKNVANAWYKNNNQFLIGTMVNLALIYSGLRFKKTFGVLAVILLPCLCTITLGLLGVNAAFMMYMIPFIWLGNTAITLAFRYTFKFIYSDKKIRLSTADEAKQYDVIRYSIASVLGIGVKVALIFGGFLILRGFDLFSAPVAERLYKMMGLAQLITASCGAVLAFGAVKATGFSKRETRG